MSFIVSWGGINPKFKLLIIFCQFFYLMKWSIMQNGQPRDLPRSACCSGECKRCIQPPRSSSGWCRRERSPRHLHHLDAWSCRIHRVRYICWYMPEKILLLMCVCVFVWGMFTRILEQMYPDAYLDSLGWTPCPHWSIVLVSAGLNRVGSGMFLASRVFGVYLICDDMFMSCVYIVKLD